MTIEQATRTIATETDRVILENLRDPDLAAKSADYRAGYECGFREAMAAFVLAKLKKHVETPPATT